MKEFFYIIKRFTPPYSKYLIANIFGNLLGAIFGVFSFLLIEPVLSILFNIHKDVTTLPQFELNISYVRSYFNFIATSLKNTYGVNNTLLWVGMFFVLMAIFKVMFTYLAAISMVNVKNSIVRDIRKLLYHKILNLPLLYFTEKKKGDIISRITNDVNEVDGSIMSSLEYFFKNPILIIIYLSTMFMMSWQLTLFVILVLPLSGFIISRVGKKLKQQSLLGQHVIGKIVSTLDETLGGLRIVKAFNAETKMQNRFGEEINAIRHIMNKLSFRRFLAHPLSEVLGSLTIMIVLWYGGTLILNDNSSLSAPGFIAYLAIFYSIIKPAKGLTDAFYAVQKGLAAMMRIDQILDTEDKIKEAENAKSIESFDDKIAFNHVNFFYDNHKTVLKDITVEIKKGTTVALVGRSGVGKTTFVNLLPRFYDVCEGSITIDGVDVKDLKIRDLRDLIGNVNQESILFNTTIAENISFGVKNIDMKQIVKAAKIAYAHNFIIKKDNQYDTIIGDRGDKLSGGQRQRLSIARAVMKNPPILILDEATSSLDTESEKLVQEALINLMKERTTIVIAHRLSTIINADMICVFKDGEIVEKGNHKELLKLEGEYKKLYDLQMIK